MATSRPMPFMTMRMLFCSAFAGLMACGVPVRSADVPTAPEPALPPPQAPSAGSLLQPESAPGLAPPPKAVAVDEEEFRALRAIPHAEYRPNLADAISAGDDRLITYLLEAGVPSNGAAVNGESPLCAALRQGRPDTALMLLMHGADPNEPGADGQRPLALASLRRHPQLMRVLLAAGADPNVTYVSPCSKALLDAAADPYLRDQLKRERNVTPLMVCAARGDVESVALLLQWGASKGKHTLPNHRYAINFAADKRYLFVMRLLLGRDPDNEPRVLITVNLTLQRAFLEVEGETKLQTAISTGRAGYDTPAGRYVITNKYKHWVSTLYDVPMPYFMRLNCGAIGLHSGYVTGRPASHGCIRLPHEMAKKFFGMAGVGDEVNIEY